MHPINYEQLLSDYGEALNTQLRGFRPSEEYLDLWVPDNDPTKSILSLVEAAEMAGKEEIKVEISSATMSSMDMPKLSTLVGRISRSMDVSGTTGGKQCIHVVLKDSGKEKPVAAGDGPSPYRLALSALLGAMDFNHEGKEVAPNEGRPTISVERDGATLSLSFYGDAYRIKEARFFFRSITSPQIKALFELVCETVEGLTMQEAAEHAVMKVEYGLRGQQATVKGIVTPRNADPIFQLPIALLREAYKQLKAKAGLKEGINFSDRSPGSEWTSLKAESQMARAQEVVTQYLKSAGYAGTELVVSSLQGQGNTRVFCMAEGELKREDLPQLLMHLERHLRLNVEGRLEVFLDEKKDMNSKRRL